MWRQSWDSGVEGTRDREGIRQPREGGEYVYRSGRGTPTSEWSDVEWTAERRAAEEHSAVRSDRHGLAKGKPKGRRSLPLPDPPRGAEAPVIVEARRTSIGSLSCSSRARLSERCKWSPDLATSGSRAGRLRPARQRRAGRGTLADRPGSRPLAAEDSLRVVELPGLPARATWRLLRGRRRCQEVVRCASRRQLWTADCDPEPEAARGASCGANADVLHLARSGHPGAAAVARRLPPPQSRCLPSPSARRLGKSSQAIVSRLAWPAWAGIAWERAS
jgi:hypothetical protein